MTYDYVSGMVRECFKTVTEKVPGLPEELRRKAMADGRVNNLVNHLTHGFIFANDHDPRLKGKITVKDIIETSVDFAHFFLRNLMTEEQDRMITQAEKARILSIKQQANDMEALAGQIARDEDERITTTKTGEETSVATHEVPEGIL